MAKKKTYSAEFKAKVALEAIKERESLSDLAVRFEVMPTEISAWKNEFIQHAQQVFINHDSQKKESEHEKERLNSKVEQLQVDVDFLAKVYKAAGLKKR